MVEKRTGSFTGVSKALLYTRGFGHCFGGTRPVARMICKE
jgi:hypothetical protein